MRTYIYADDIDADKLTIQLALLKQQVTSNGVVNLHLPDVIGYMTKTPNYVEYLSEVVKLAELILVAAATNATSDRSLMTSKNFCAYINDPEPL